MKKISKYACDFCGSVYDNESDALECEINCRKSLEDWRKKRPCCFKKGDFVRHKDNGTFIVQVIDVHASDAGRYYLVYTTGFCRGLRDSFLTSTENLPVEEVVKEIEASLSKLSIHGKVSLITDKLNITFSTREQGSDKALEDVCLDREKTYKFKK